MGTYIYIYIYIYTLIATGGPPKEDPASSVAHAAGFQKSNY